MAFRDNSPAISFFSFQDIITSITGIMFLVVIMLVLVVLRQNPFPDPRRDEALRKELAELERDLDATRTQLETLRRRSAEQDKRIEELKKLRPETLPELKNDLIRRLRGSDDAIRQLEERIALAERRREELAALEKEAENLAAGNRDAVAEAKREIAALDMEIERRERRYAKIRNVIRFVWDKSNPKRPVLLECGGGGIRLSGIDDGVEPRVFPDYRVCLAHCRTFPADETYFILLLKPSAFPYAEKFSRELRKAGYERGREVLPDEQSVIAGGTRE